MSVQQLLKQKECEDLWEMSVEHPFVKQLVCGDLDHDKFRDYLIQDKLLCETLRGFVCSVLADCPDADDFEGLHKLIAELQGYGHEAELFKDMFGKLQVSKGDMRPHPTTEAFSNFLWRVSTTGSLEDKLIVLYGVHGTYMDWACRAQERGAKPGHEAYSRWIEIHTPANLGRLVDWIKRRLDEILGANGQRLTHHHMHLFKRTLQYEVMFWDSAYRPGSSVFPGEFGLQRSPAVSGQ